MRHQKIVLLICLNFCLGSASFLRAGEISLSQCLELAKTKSLQDIQASLQEAKSNAQSSSASAQLLPKLSGVARYTGTDNPATNLPDDNEAIVQVEQNLLPFLSPDWIRAGEQKAQAKAVQIDRLTTRQDVDFLVKQLYFSVLRDQDAVERINQVTGQFQTLLDYLTPQFNVGRIPRFDEVKVEAALSDLARLRSQTLDQLALEKMELSLVLGFKPGESLNLTTLSALPEMPSSLNDGVVEENPTLLSLGQRAEAARIGLDADHFARLPSLSAHFLYGYQSQTWDTLSPGWDVGVELHLPIFDWGVISAQADQDRADWKLAQNAMESQRQQLLIQLQQIQASANTNLTDLRRMKELLPKTEKASRASVRQYRTGAMGIVETTDAVNLWLTTSLNERNAYYSYLTSLALLEQLTGGKWKVNYE